MSKDKFITFPNPIEDLSPAPEMFLDTRAGDVRRGFWRLSETTARCLLELFDEFERNGDCRFMGLANELQNDYNNALVLLRDAMTAYKSGASSRAYGSGGAR